MKISAFLFWVFLLLNVLSSCDQNEIEPKSEEDSDQVELTSLKEVSDSKSNTYKVSFENPSGNNQNPIVTKKDKEGNVIWKKTYETTSVDGRANLINIDSEGNPWVVFSVDGGSTSSNFINKKETAPGAFASVFMNGYGMGGGPKVSIIAKLDPNTGKIQKGTFVSARLNSGKTNSLAIKAIGFNKKNVVFRISSAAWPPSTGKKYKKYPNITNEDRVNGSFIIRYEIKKDLSEIVKAELSSE